MKIQHVGLSILFFPSDALSLISHRIWHGEIVYHRREKQVGRGRSSEAEN